MTVDICIIIQAVSIILLSFAVNSHSRTLRKMTETIEGITDHLLLTRLNLYDHIGQDDVHGR